MRSLRWLVVPILCLGFGSASANLIQPDLEIRCLAEPHPVVAGEYFETDVEILAARPLEIQEIRVQGTDWLSLEHDAPGMAVLAEGESLRFHVGGIPESLEDPLRIGVLFDGRWVERKLVLDRWARDRGQRGHGRVLALPPELEARVPDAPYEPSTLRGGGSPPVWLPPVDDPLYGQDPEDTDDPPAMGKGGRNIHVQGRLLYFRGDGEIVGLYGATVRLYDEDTTWDEWLGTTTTDVHGNWSIDFYWDPCYVCDSNPDLYIEIESENNFIEVEEAGVLERNYFWDSPRWDDYTGTNLDMYKGYIDANVVAADILTVISRGHLWLEQEQGIDLSKVDVQWPSDECSAAKACYKQLFEEIHVSHEADWANDTYLHEWGHHLMENWGAYTPPDYCNEGDYCDDGGCSHCMWCPENGSIALTEGFPNWLADVIIRDWEQTYLDPPMYTRDQEGLGYCDGGPPVVWGDPHRTEGFFGALLRDMEDLTQDQHGYYPPSAGTKDLMALGTDEILYVMLGYDGQGTFYQTPLNPQEFIDLFRARYPEKDHVFWSTAKNCGYDFDDTPPFAPDHLDSPTHFEGIATTNAYVTLTWGAPYDDASGLHGYSYELATSVVEPDETVDLSLVTQTTLGPLAPGNYWFTIKAVDNDGNWSTTYAGYGPIVVSAPTPVDLAWQQMMGWDYPLVPRGDRYATRLDASVSETLPGDDCCTSWSYSGSNAGDDPVPGDYFLVNLYIDGNLEHASFEDPVGGHSSYYRLNVGLETITAGRHTLEIRHDGAGQVSEPDEDNNTWGHQFVWQPHTLMPLSTTRVTGGVPAPEGGWESVVDGSSVYENCRGHRIQGGSSTWDAVSIATTLHTNNFKLGLFQPSTGSEDGFATPMKISSRSKGLLDALVVNGHVQGGQAWDWGVGFVDGDRMGWYDIEHVPSVQLPPSLTRTLSMDEDEFLDLTEVVLGPDAGPITVTLERTSAEFTGYVYVGWLDPDGNTSTLNALDHLHTLDMEGFVQFQIPEGPEGSSCVVVYREPVETEGAVTLQLTVEPERPNVLPITMTGWDGPLVPTDGSSSTPVTLSSSLPGDQARTYLNFALMNQSINPTSSGGSFFVRVDLDGGPITYVSVPDLPGGWSTWHTGSSGYTVRGGRHTLTMVCDPMDEIPEASEDDNATGVQYAWKPTQMALNGSLTRTVPPDPTAGWELLPAAPHTMNCDGVRTPSYDPRVGPFVAVATLPEEDTGVELRLYPRKDSPALGFVTPYSSSHWGPNLSDYALVNVLTAKILQFDVGILQSSGTGGYTVENRAADILEWGPGTRRYGPFYLTGEQIVRLHALQLDAGGHVFRLDITHGNADLGLGLHEPTDPYQAKADAVAASWFNGPGEDEYLSYDVPADDGYCLVVWRRNNVDRHREVEYYLEIDAGFTDAPPGVAVARAGIEWVAPNPFNPRVTVAYRLLEEQAVTLEVFDLRGQKVRTLVDGVLAAGPHTESWDGVDASGARVASGVYFLRWSTPDLQETRKAVLVK